MSEIQKTPENNPKCIQDLLKINNVKRITKFDEINQIYDYKKLLENDTVEINTEINNIIIFDTDVFNSCYVIDVFNKFMENNKFNEAVIVNYCDNMGIYEELFRKFLKERFNFQKPIPIILFVIGNKSENNDLYIITEPVIGTITEEDFTHIKNILDAN